MKIVKTYQFHLKSIYGEPTVDGTVGESVKVDVWEDDDGDVFVDPSVYKPAHPLFMAVERYFEEWLEELSPGNYIKGMYEDSFEEMDGKSYYSKKAAIEAGVRTLVEYMEDMELEEFEENNFYRVDLEAIFQD